MHWSTRLDKKTGNPNAIHTRMFTSDGKVKHRIFVIRIASAGKQQNVGWM